MSDWLFFFFCRRQQDTLKPLVTFICEKIFRLKRLDVSSIAPHTKAHYRGFYLPWAVEFIEIKLSPAAEKPDDDAPAVQGDHHEKQDDEFDEVQE